MALKTLFFYHSILLIYLNFQDKAIGFNFYIKNTQILSTDIYEADITKIKLYINIIINVFLTKR